MSALLDKVIAAYGGRELWNAASRVRAVVSSGGLAFALKRRPPFRHANLVCDVHRPWCSLTPIGHEPGIAGTLDGAATRLETADGDLIERRENARSYFPLGRRFFWWDDLDIAYFANYAFWNYLTLPARLMSPDVAVTQASSDRLVVTFPDHVPTHCRRQVFHVDPETGLLRQHDYTADVVGRFARAANVVVEHGEAGGIAFTSRRRVTPRGPAGKPLPKPVLIYITVHEFGLQ